MAENTPKPDRSTLIWLREAEQAAFGTASRESLPKSIAAEFIRNATVLVEMLAHEIEDYAEYYMDREYEREIWDDLRLKAFAIVDYPLGVIETLFRDGKKHLVQNLIAGIYPLREINALALRTPGNEPAVLFSEWLFSFLWDYYSINSSNFVSGNHGDVIKRDLEFGKKLEGSLYHNWDIQPIIDDKRLPEIARWHVLLSLVYIFAHEIGHVILGHVNRAPRLLREIQLYGDKRERLEVYSYRQVEELDADMFASDIYYSLLGYGLKFEPGTFLRSAHMRGFSLLSIKARLEEHIPLGEFVGREHPPSILRESCMLLRHREQIEAQGFSLERVHRIVEEAWQYLQEYDYDKDLGTRELLGQFSDWGP